MTDLELFKATHPHLYELYSRIGRVWVTGYKQGEKKSKNNYTYQNKYRGKYHD